MDNSQDIRTRILREVELQKLRLQQLEYQYESEQRQFDQTIELINLDIAHLKSNKFNTDDDNEYRIINQSIEVSELQKRHLEENWSQRCEQHDNMRAAITNNIAQLDSRMESISGSESEVKKISGHKKALNDYFNVGGISDKDRLREYFE